MQIKIETTGYVNELNVFDLYVVHGIVFATCWGLLALLQIAAARWLKMYHKVSMWIHRISGFVIFLATFIMAMFTFKQDDWEIKSGYHPAMGLTIVITMSLLTIGGITARLFLEKSRWNTVMALRIKLGHKLFGALVIFLAQITLVLGGIAYADRGHSLAETLVIIETVIFFVLVFAFEILF
jgi:hypothetical protein